MMSKPATIFFLSAGFAGIAYLLGHNELASGIMFGAGMANLVNGIVRKP